MYYEIYVDTFFVLQFILNLYLLELVNQMLYHVASWKRVFGGAVLGAVCSLLPFLLPVGLGYSMLGSFFLSFFSMSLFTFRAFRAEQLMKVLEKMLVMTLLLGGVLLFLLKLLPDTRGTFFGMIGVLTLGAVSYIWICRLMKNSGASKSTCMVTLEGRRGKLRLEALIDTGNSLIEPVSGVPVAVMQEEAFRELYGEDIPEFFRVIPYTSVGKRNGILRGYPLEHIQIEVQGVKKDCCGAYVAVCGELLMEKSGYKMILNPRMLEM